MKFLIGITDLFYYGELCVSVKVVSFSMEMLARRDRVIGWFVCVGSVIVQPYVERGLTLANILRLAFKFFFFETFLFLMIV